MPVLFYCGDLDPYHEPTRMASSRIAGSNFVSVPGENHIGVPRRVDILGPAIRSFLSK